MRPLDLPVLAAFVALSACTTINTIRAVPLTQGVMRTFTVAPSAAIDAARSALAQQKLEITSDATQGDSQVIIGESSARAVVMRGQYVRVVVTPNSQGAVVRVVIKDKDTGGMISELKEKDVLEEIARTIAAQPAVATAAPAPSAAAPAQTQAASGGDWVHAAPQPAAHALIIGIEGYRDLPPPTGAEGDAKAFEKLARDTLGLTTEHVRVALGNRATKTDLQGHLEWLTKSASAGGRLYLFFSGHGSPEPASGTPYLLPYDANPKDLAGSALRLSTVLEALEKSKAKEVLVFVDSCFSGAGGRSVLAPGTRPLVRVRDEAPGARVALFAASAADETSGPAPKEARGAFTKYLTEGLGTGQADVNGDGQVTMQELAAWVSPRVTRAAKEDGRTQTPHLKVGTSMSSADHVVVSWGYR